ncbi:LLM class flavin-dependent oxidoreductase [Pseudonocardia bannensis]|uniref:LLM class flavin-dependent oxidoreductase n=1 Tax=Pseudonocardia bannensis TaxID=630973 RepID=A0A848DQI0_9PSEU|nr:LLM class flavin-dependent oxidoreductase [Pseudonocardia bannensis]NMH94696.1 LLM class flavin-dependent oxidoreductase [Pseudonocardia bannensis]
MSDRSIRQRPLHLAVEVSGAGLHPGAWRRPEAPGAGVFEAGYHIGLAETAARGHLDFLAVSDSFGPPGADPSALRGSLDAVAVAARVAPVVPGIGLVPTATVTHTEPFHLSKAIATLDFVSSGRAGWEPAVSRTQAEADLFGRKNSAAPTVLWREAAEAIEVVVRLWDSWEDDAEIRDVATGRFIDRDKLHYIDFSGEFFSVKGPSITPRSPQAHPLIVLRGDEPEALAVGARWADVVRIVAPSVAAAAGARRRVRAAVADAGRDPDVVAVLLDVEVLLSDNADAARRDLAELDGWAGELPPSTLRVIGTPAELADTLADAYAAGAADGFTAVPLALPGGLAAIADGVVPLLTERGLFRAGYDEGATLRGRFGLARPANPYAQGASA